MAHILLITFPPLYDLSSKRGDRHTHDTELEMHAQEKYSTIHVSGFIGYVMVLNITAMWTESNHFQNYLAAKATLETTHKIPASEGRNGTVNVLMTAEDATC